MLKSVSSGGLEFLRSRVQGPGLNFFSGSHSGVIRFVGCKVEGQ